MAMWASTTFSSMMQSLKPKKNRSASISERVIRVVDMDSRKDEGKPAAGSNSVKNLISNGFDSNHDETRRNTNRDAETVSRDERGLTTHMGVDATGLGGAETEEESVAGAVGKSTQESMTTDAGDTKIGARKKYAMSQVLVGTFGDTSGLAGLESEADEDPGREGDRDNSGSWKSRSRDAASGRDEPNRSEDGDVGTKGSPAMDLNRGTNESTDQGLSALTEMERPLVDPTHEASKKRIRSTGQKTSDTNAKIQKCDRASTLTKPRRIAQVDDDKTEPVPGVVGQKEQSDFELRINSDFVASVDDNIHPRAPLPADRLLSRSPTTADEPSLLGRSGSENPRSPGSLEVLSEFPEPNHAVSMHRSEAVPGSSGLEDRREAPGSEFVVNVLTTETEEDRGEREFGNVNMMWDRDRKVVSCNENLDDDKKQDSDAESMELPLNSEYRLSSIFASELAKPGSCDDPKSAEPQKLVPMRFYIGLTKLDRSDLAEKIVKNGGRVVSSHGGNLDPIPTYPLADRKSRVKSTGRFAYSDTYVEDSIKAGRALDLENYRLGRRVSVRDRRPQAEPSERQPIGSAENGGSGDKEDANMRSHKLPRRVSVRGHGSQAKLTEAQQTEFAEKGSRHGDDGANTLSNVPMQSCRPRGSVRNSRPEADFPEEQAADFAANESVGDKVGSNTQSWGNTPERVPPLTGSDLVTFSPDDDAVLLEFLRSQSTHSQRHFGDQTIWRKAEGLRVLGREVQAHDMYCRVRHLFMGASNQSSGIPKESEDSVLSSDGKDTPKSCLRIQGSTDALEGLNSEIINHREASGINFDQARDLVASEVVEPAARSGNSNAESRTRESEEARDLVASEVVEPAARSGPKPNPESRILQSAASAPNSNVLLASVEDSRVIKSNSEKDERARLFFEANLGRNVQGGPQASMPPGRALSSEPNLTTAEAREINTFVSSKLRMAVEQLSRHAGVSKRRAYIAIRHARGQYQKAFEHLRGKG